jgi:hypothetical protein
MPAARWGRLLLALPDPWVSDTDVRGARTVRCADRGRIADGRHDTLTGMNTMMQFDDSVSRKVEAVYSTADIVEHRHAIQNLLDLQPGEDVLDIGSGPGFLAVEMAVRVGASGSVHGIEPSEQMRGVAARRRPGDPAAPRASTSRPLPRCTSTSPTCRPHWPRRTACCVREDGC